jgi:carbonic anhydrase/acetyltransferase-like protein (isoleucine patch superfamily)
LIRDLQGKRPFIHHTAYIADSAEIIGDVAIGENSSIWFNTVIRGDINFIKIGKNTNIQDGTIIHVAHDLYPTIIGDSVTIGHGAIIHASIIGNNCLIGMGAVIMDGVQIGDNCIVAAGSVVTAEKKFPACSLIIGVPAKLVRTINDEEIKKISKSASNYRSYVKLYID